MQITRRVSDFHGGRSVYAGETFLRCRANDEALEASEWLECHFDRERFVFQVRGKVSDENAPRTTAALLFVRDRWENILPFRLFRVRSTILDISFDFWTWSSFFNILDYTFGWNLIGLYYLDRNPILRNRTMFYIFIKGKLSLNFVIKYDIN